MKMLWVLIFARAVLLRIPFSSANHFIKRSESREFIKTTGDATGQPGSSRSERGTLILKCKANCNTCRDENNELYCCYCYHKPCFPSTVTVQTVGGEAKRMSELTKGDLVLTVSEDGALKYSEIRTFLQKQSDTVSTYLSISTSTNNIISLSASHLIYTRKTAFEDYKPIYADHVEVGDEVLVQGNDELTPANVTNISSEIMQGAYVPLTMEGTILVDGALASCYASFDHHLVHIAMTPIRWFPGVMEWIFGWDNGSPSYVNIIKNFGKWIIPHGLQHKTPQLFDLYQNYFSV